MKFLSLQIDPPYVRIALIERKNSKFEIKSLRSGRIDTPDSVKPLYKPRFTGKVVSGISGRDLLVKEVHLKIGKGPHLEKALIFQAQTSLFLPSEEILEIPYVLKKGKEGTEALLFVVSAAALEHHLEQMKNFHLDPDRVGSFSLALVRYVRWKLPSLIGAYLVDLGSSDWSAVWMEGGELKKSFSILGGTEALLKAYWEDKKNSLLLEELESLAKEVNLKKVYAEEHPIFYDTLLKMRLELAKVLFSFYQQGGAKAVIFTGRLDAFRNFSEFLQEGFQEVRLQDSPRLTSSEELKYALAIGLAMEPTLQLRQGKFFPKRILKKKGVLACLFSLASLGLGAFIFLVGKVELEQRKKEISHSLSSAIQKFDPTFSSLYEEPEPLFYNWMEKIQKHAKEFPFFPKMPKASEVLSWLSSAPLLKSFREAGDPIEILDFQYELVQFPSLKARNEPYLAKVDLSFQVKDPITARKFHEFLLKEKTWIQQDEEVSWDIQKGIYRTSFFLKHKEAYDF